MIESENHCPICRERKPVVGELPRNVHHSWICEEVLRLREQVSEQSADLDRFAEALVGALPVGGISTMTVRVSMTTATLQQRYDSLMELTRDFVRLYCPCSGEGCNGRGCDECGRTGADAGTLLELRKTVAHVLEEVASAGADDLYRLATCLRVPLPVPGVLYNAGEALAAGMVITCLGPAGGGGSGRKGL